MSETFTYQAYHKRQKLLGGPAHGLVFEITSWYDLGVGRSRPLALTSLCARVSAQPTATDRLLGHHDIRSHMTLKDLPRADGAIVP